MKSINRMSLSHQFVGASILLGGMVILGLALFVSSYTYRLGLEHADREVKGHIHGLRQLVDTTHEISVGLTDKVSSIFLSRFPEPFVLHPDRPIRVGTADTPTLDYQGRPINLDFTTVDDFARTSGGVATVFVRKGDDFVRVSTSLKTEAGERAVGTALAADHPAKARLIAGETYLGVAKLFGRQYMTKYTPARDKDGKVVGALFVGFDLTGAFGSLKTALESIRFGTTGYAFMVRAKGSEKGLVIFHPVLAGKNAAEIRDADGGQPLDKMLAGSAGSVTYPWREADGSIQTKIAYYEQTDSLGGLVVAGGGYMKDFTAESIALRNIILVAASVAALVLSLLLYAFITHQMRPVKAIVEVLGRIGAGDLQARIRHEPHEEGTRNELHIIANNIDATARNVGALIAELRQQATEIEDTAATLSRTSEALAGAAATQNDASHAMANGVGEMAASIQQVSDNARSADAHTRETRQQAARGQEATRHVIAQMGSIEQAVSAAAARIQQLGEASGHISTVVSVIREVADQTNLLALNAAIEAARAGEQGRGFAVVADEVRKLAERTAASTQEIARVVESIQTGTRDAIQGMASAREQVATGVEKVEASGRTMSEIEAGAEEVATIAAEMSASLRQQAAASSGIGDEVARISHISGQNDASAREALAAASTLARLSRRMSEAVDRFRVEH
ncbi:methyl-accepting chemotaxis protein [Zoogloea sp.]|jgi:methyl-accepting chemotaxis protein|uniref:methyl-accepting chemotaxis protein n=1 Tax=Zoogloea sp. TaxID=49181 RepID=UPI0035B2C84E